MLDKLTMDVPHGHEGWGVGWYSELVTPRWSATGTFAEWVLSHFIWSFHRSLCFFRPRRTSAKATDGPCRVGSWDNWSPFASGDKAHIPGARPAQANRETGSGPVPSTSGPVAGPLYLLPDMDQEKIPLRGYKANGKFSSMYFTKLKRKTMEYISLVISDIHPKNLQTALIKGAVLKGIQASCRPRMSMPLFWEDSAVTCPFTLILSQVYRGACQRPPYTQWHHCSIAECLLVHSCCSN